MPTSGAVVGSSTNTIGGVIYYTIFFFSSRRRHTRLQGDWSSDVCSSDLEIADAKSYLTGVFPIRLETQEGLTDQLVQIKMLNLPDYYLQTYRDRVQAVTIDEIQRVAAKYVRPDEAALVVVGDGSSVLDQIKPYCKDVEIYNTTGKRKTAESSGITDPVGSWSIEV